MLWLSRQRVDIETYKTIDGVCNANAVNCFIVSFLESLQGLFNISNDVLGILNSH